MQQRVVPGGILDYPRQDARAREVEARRTDPEVAFGGRSDPVRAVPEVHAVEVELQDLLLRQIRLQPDRDRGVLQLPPRGAVVASQVQDLRELLGQRAAALRQGEVARVECERSRETDDVDPVMAVEPLVLGGDDRLLEDRRDRTKRDEPTPDRAQPREDLFLRSCRCRGGDPRSNQDGRQEDGDARDAGQQASAPHRSSLNIVGPHIRTVGRTRRPAEAEV